MGAASSKAGRAAAGAAKRQYPQRVPANPTPTSGSTTSTTASSGATGSHNPPPAARSQGPNVHPEPSASQTRDTAIDRDARDPDFAASLRSIGPVQTNPVPSFTPSTSQQPTSSGTMQLPSSSPPPSAPTPSFRNNPRDAIAAPQATSPHQTVFPSRANNPALQVLEARTRLAREAEREMLDIGRQGAPARRFLDVMQVKQVLAMRDVMGKSEGEIERALGLKEGTVARLGKRGTLGQAQ